MKDFAQFFFGSIMAVVGIGFYLFLSGAAIVVPVMFFLWVLSGCK